MTVIQRKALKEGVRLVPSKEMGNTEASTRDTVQTQTGSLPCEVQLNKEAGPRVQQLSSST